MPSADAASRLAVQRYRTRLLVVRLSMGRPPTFQLVNLALAVIGAWSVFYQLGKLLPGNNTALVLTLAGVVAAALAAVLVWLRLARRPQDLFRSAALSESRAEALRKAMSDGMARDFAYENLARLYAPVVTEVTAALPAARVSWPTDRAGRRCLVITIAPSGPRRLGELITGAGAPRDAHWSERAAKFAAERQELMATLRRSVSLANRFGDEAGANIILDEITAAPDLAMTVNTASYGQIVRTCDSLVNEFAVFAHLASRSAFRRRPLPLSFRADDLLKVLPWRRQVHSWDDRAALLLAPRGRAAGLGVSLALVDRRDGGASAYVARRSASVGTYPDVLHVVPSGMVNARGDDRPVREDLASLPRLTMMSEFLEECFDVAELSGHSVGNFTRRVEQQLAARRLGDLDPVFTGLAVDLLNLRTEVCGVLDLTGHAATVDAFDLSWEYTHTDRLRRIDLTAASPALRRTDFVQSGIGSIELAASWSAARRTPATGPP